MEFSAVIDNAKLGTCSSNIRPQDCLQINLLSVLTDPCHYMGNKPPRAMLPLTLPHNFSYKVGYAFFSAGIMMKGRVDTVSVLRTVQNRNSQEDLEHSSKIRLLAKLTF